MSTKNQADPQVPRVLVVTGAAYTGSTTVARALADASGWRLRSVGGELRRYCERNGIDLAHLPIEVHAEFDRQTIELLASSERLVVEGRFLALLSEPIRDILKIQTVANDRVRGFRCARREGIDDDWLRASAIVRRRDDEDRALAMQLYGRDDYLLPIHYHLIRANEVPADVTQTVSAVARLVPGLITS